MRCGCNLARAHGQLCYLRTTGYIAHHTSDPEPRIINIVYHYDWASSEAH
jgi:hypothetical protein